MTQTPRKLLVFSITGQPLSGLTTQIVAAWEKGGGIIDFETIGHDTPKTGTEPSYIILDEATTLDEMTWDLGGMPDQLVDPQHGFQRLIEFKDPRDIPADIRNRQLDFYAQLLDVVSSEVPAPRNFRGLNSMMIDLARDATRYAVPATTDAEAKPIPHWQQLNGSGKPWKRKR